MQFVTLRMTTFRHKQTQNHYKQIITLEFIMKLFINTILGLLTAFTTQLSYSGEKLHMKEYTNEGVYYFYYPSTCDIRWHSSRNNRTISFRCPTPTNDSQFDKYEVNYGSGNRSDTFDNKDFGIFIADGEWYTRRVYFTPHDITAFGRIWSNFKIIPLF